MARNMTLMNQELFNKLKQFLPRETPAETLPIARWITTTLEEKKWLQNVKFETDADLQFGDQRSLSLASLESEIYLLSVGLELDLPQGDFDSLPINSGLFCAALFELKIQPSGGDDMGNKLLQYIFMPIQAGVNKIPYLLDSIVDFFPKIRLFRINSGSPLLKPETNLFQIALFAATKCQQLISLNWTVVGLENARLLSVAQKPFLPFELVLRAITERKYQHAFLDVYRCLEYLFPFTKINKLKDKLEVNHSTADLSEHVEEILGWRASEESAMKLLIETLPREIISGFQKAFLPELIGDDLPTKVAVTLYKLRNDCVHFRPIQRVSTLQSNVKWELLLQTMLAAIRELYEKEFRIASENIELSPRSIRFDDDTLWVSLSDGRTIAAPLAWFPRLLNAGPEERAKVELSKSGLRWAALNENISVAGLLAGQRDLTSHGTQAAA